MFESLIVILAIFITIVDLTSSISITGIVDTSHPKEPLLVLPHMKKTNLRTEGIFVRFLRNLLELLTTTFPDKKLPKYCRILSRHLNELDYKHGKKLARHLKYMSRMYRDDLKNELISYKEELEKKRQHRTDFLDAMNKIFTLQEHILFDDYIYELKNYGTDDKLFIHEETEKLINNVIMKSVERLSTKDRYDLLKKLKYAIKEYNYDWN